MSYKPNKNPLISLSEAQKKYGVEKTTFDRPRFVDVDKCEWCGKVITDKRRSSCCCNGHSLHFNAAIKPAWYLSVRSVGGYRGHILRRDRFTCQLCGDIHVKYSEFGIPLPATDGQLDVHHIIPTSEGGTDSPDNLITICRVCYKKLHRKQEEANANYNDTDY